MEDVRASKVDFWEIRSGRKAWRRANGAMTLAFKVSDHAAAERLVIGTAEGSRGGRRTREDNWRLWAGV